MVHLVAKGLVSGQAVLQLFESKLVGVDLLFDVKAARSVAEAAIRAKRPDMLKELLAACTSGSRQVSLLRMFGAERRLKCAEEVFKACPEQTACLHNTLLDIYVDAGELAFAEGVMMKATKAGLADVVTYNTMIKAHLRNGDIRRARSSVETMRSVGLTPNCITFNELIDAAFKNDPTAVWGLIDEMQACGLKPNQVTCSILLKHVHRHSTAADVHRTLSMLNSMSEGIDEVLLSSICEACIRSGQQELLRQQLRRTRGPGCVVVRGAHTFGSIIRAYGFVQDLEGVWATWREMRKRHILPTSITLGCMVEALVGNDGPDAGYEMICEMLGHSSTRPLVNAVIYCSLLKGLVHQKRFDRVWEIYEEMQADMKALQFSVATYNLLIDACARSCDMARVPTLLKEMSQQHIEPNVITFSTIVKGYCQENQLDKAFDLLEDMKHGKSFKPDEITYNTLLDGCARHGLLERGLCLLQDMQDAGVPPSNFTLSVLVKLASRSYRLEKAFDLCADISKKYRFKLNVHVYNNLINACIQHREVDRALEVFEQSVKERVRPDSRTYSLLGRALATEGDAKGAAGILRAAFGLSGDVHPAAASADPKMLQVRGGLPSEVLSQILEGLAREGDRAMVMKLVADLRRLPSVKLDSRLAMRLTSQLAGRY
jgi:pentatricopeptide repeat protein